MQTRGKRSRSKIIKSNLCSSLFTNKKTLSSWYRFWWCIIFYLFIIQKGKPSALNWSIVCSTGNRWTRTSVGSALPAPPTPLLVTFCGARNLSTKIVQVFIIPIIEFKGTLLISKHKPSISELTIDSRFWRQDFSRTWLDPDLDRGRIKSSQEWSPNSLSNINSGPQIINRFCKNRFCKKKRFVLLAY